MIYFGPVLYALPIKKMHLKFHIYISYTLIYLEPVLHALPIKKMRLKFHKYRHRISAAERLTTASCPLHVITFLF